MLKENEKTFVDNMGTCQEWEPARNLIRGWWVCKTIQLLCTSLGASPYNLTLMNLPKRNEITGPHKNASGNAHTSFIHNSPKLETTQMPINMTDKDWFTDKQLWAIVRGQRDNLGLTVVGRTDTKMPESIIVGRETRQSCKKDLEKDRTRLGVRKAGMKSWENARNVF